VNQAARREPVNTPCTGTGATGEGRRKMEFLAQAYAAELETVQSYLANSVSLDGLGAKEVSEPNRKQKNENENANTIIQ
jgi:hypothetical protein